MSELGRLFASAFWSFEVSLLRQTEVTDAPRTGKRSNHNDALHFVINQSVKKNEGKMQRMRKIKEETVSEIFTCLPFSFVCKAGFKSAFISSQQSMSDDNTSALVLSEPAAVTYKQDQDSYRIPTIY